MPESPRSEFAEFDFSEFTEEDFTAIDAVVAEKLNTPEPEDIEDISQKADRRSTYSDAFSWSLDSFSSEELLELDSAIAGHFDNIEAAHEISQGPTVESQQPSQASFQSEIYGLNLNHLDIEEIAALDSVVAHKLAQIHRGPQVQIQVDEAEDSPHQLPFNKPLPVEEPDTMNPAKAAWNFSYRDWSKLSPMQQYRRHGIFSVTDLVSPAWCELQYDYGLRGKRSRPAKDRPKSFKSASGKTIFPEQKVSADNEVITKQGQDIHKALEKEVKPVEVKVDVTTDETRWALRLINMIGSLEGLRQTFTREMPVFGIVHGEVVVGIIDEVDRVETPAVESPKRSMTRLCEVPPPKRTKVLSGTVHQTIRELVPSKEDKGKAREIERSNSMMDVEECRVQRSKSYSLRLKDNKTRGAMSLPSDDDAYSGKMQLMLYRRLLQDLLATSPPYDFSQLWQKVGVDSKAQFPEGFLLQAPLIDHTSGVKSVCLDDLALELIYRHRSSKSRKKSFAHIPRGDPDEDLARAILASLADVPPEVRAKTLSAQAGGSGAGIAADDDDQLLQWALKESLKDGGSGKHAGVASENDALQVDETDIIGTKVFVHNDQELDGFIGNVLRWWRGERKAQGVDLDRSYRCNTCEYKTDCEWREEKALEFQNKSKAE